MDKYLEILVYYNIYVNEIKPFIKKKIAVHYLNSYN